MLVIRRRRGATFPRLLDVQLGEALFLAVRLSPLLLRVVALHAARRAGEVEAVVEAVLVTRPRHVFDALDLARRAEQEIHHALFARDDVIVELFELPEERRARDEA